LIGSSPTILKFYMRRGFRRYYHLLGLFLISWFIPNGLDIKN